MSSIGNSLASTASDTPLLNNLTTNNHSSIQKEEKITHPIDTVNKQIKTICQNYFSASNLNMPSEIQHIVFDYMGYIQRFPGISATFTCTEMEIDERSGVLLPLKEGGSLHVFAETTTLDSVISSFFFKYKSNPACDSFFLMLVPNSQVPDSDLPIIKLLETKKISYRLDQQNIIIFGYNAVEAILSSIFALHQIPTQSRELIKEKLQSYWPRYTLAMQSLTNYAEEIPTLKEQAVLRNSSSNKNKISDFYRSLVFSTGLRHDSSPIQSFQFSHWNTNTPDAFELSLFIDKSKDSAFAVINNLKNHKVNYCIDEAEETIGHFSVKISIFSLDDIKKTIAMLNDNIDVTDRKLIEDELATHSPNNSISD